MFVMINSLQITYTLHKLVFLMDKLADTTLRQEVKLTFSQFRILMAVGYKKDISQRDIADFWDLTQPAVSRQVELLMKKKLLSRRDNKENRREHLLNLTSAGEKILSQASQILNDTYSSIYKIIPKEEHGVILRNLDTLLQSMCSGKYHSFCKEE